MFGAKKNNTEIIEQLEKKCNEWFRRYFKIYWEYHGGN